MNKLLRVLYMAAAVMAIAAYFSSADGSTEEYVSAGDTCLTKGGCGGLKRVGADAPFLPHKLGVYSGIRRQRSKA